MVALSHESPESLLEQDAHYFIQNEDSGETLKLPSAEPPSQPPIKQKPCFSGPQKIFSHQETTPFLHDASLEKENLQAMDKLETSTLKDENSTNEHESFSLKVPKDSCSLKESPESCLVEINNEGHMMPKNTIATSTKQLGDPWCWNTPYRRLQHHTIGF
uniref:Uncharacterized protein n=1 Tax=Oryza sativa subsp. japonica TaxID=39947 RepID=Q6Z5U5_ORYSJ|nr:hypothetical protein [Oryza sativa Japonica Group]